MEKLLTDLLLTESNALIIGGVFAFLTTLKRVFPNLQKSGWYKRILPLLPEALCTAALFMPGVRPEGKSVFELFLLGAILGVFSSKMHKILKQSLLGEDVDIKQAKLAAFEKKAKNNVD